MDWVGVEEICEGRSMWREGTITEEPRPEDSSEAHPLIFYAMSFHTAWLGWGGR